MTEQRKVVLITGAAKRIGREIALAFARRGWDVAVHYASSRDEALECVSQIESLGSNAHAINRDLAIEAGVATLVPEVIAHFGRLDCVVNNASLFEYDTVHTCNHEHLDRHLRPNLLAPVALARALHAVVPDGGRGVVINLLDQKLDNLNPDFFSYTLSKAALHTATMMLAQALAPKLRVVGVSPGITLVSGNQSFESFVKAHQRTPLGRSSTPADVAHAVVFAAENPALTGINLVVDGGQHLAASGRDVMFNAA